MVKVARQTLKGTAAVFVAGLVAGTAHAAPAPAHSTALPPADAAALQQLAAVARQVCKSPEMFGITRSAEGQLGGQITLSKLFKSLAELGLSASVKGGVSDWKGVLQKDAAGALVASDQCAEHIFGRMFDAFYLTDVRSGRAVPKPKNPARAFMAAASPAPRAVIENRASGDNNVQTNVNGNGNTVTVAPPITEQERARAKASLRAELEELAEFPDRRVAEKPRTQMELAAPTAYSLYAILNKYYGDTIRSQTTNGPALRAFQQSFYRFVETEEDLEFGVTTECGKQVETRLRAGWDVCERYFFLRSLGMTPQQILDQGFFFNYGVTADVAEKAFAGLMRDPMVASISGRQTKAAKDLEKEAEALLRASTRVGD